MLCVWSLALVCRLESLTEAPAGPFVVVSWRGLRGSGLCVSGVMRDLKRDTNSCHESRHAAHSSVTLKTRVLFNMISVWLLFQALWQWVGENRLHYYSFAVLQCAVTELVVQCMKLGGNAQ